MAESLKPVKVIHAIRLKLQGAKAGMTTEEEIEYLNKKAEEFLVPMGKNLCYDLAGQGRLELTKV